MKLMVFMMAFILLNSMTAYPINAEKTDGKKYVREWWDIDAFFYASGNYSVTSSFEYEKETPAANLFFTIFDRDSNKFYDLGSYNDSINDIVVEKNFIRYGKCWLKINYPVFEAYFEKDDKKLFIRLASISPLTRVASGIAKNIPFGLGYYNYTFTSKCRAEGWIYINGKKSNFTGIGYYEHVYGNWSYNKPLRCFYHGMAKDYISLFKWWKQNMSLNFSNLTIWSNNPFGYDWSWGFFDNGYTIFFGNIPFWIKNIPMGIVYIYDGKKYNEFKLMEYEYLNGIYSNGSFFPTKFKIRARGNGSLTLAFEMRQNPHIYYDKLHSLYWKNLLLFESPGIIQGWWNGSRKIKLSGRGEIEIERQNSIMDYNEINVALKFPYPIGFDFYFISYLLHISLKLRMYLLPFEFHFSFSKIREQKT